MSSRPKELTRVTFWVDVLREKDCDIIDIVSPRAEIKVPGLPESNTKAGIAKRPAIKPATKTNAIGIN